LECQHIKDIKAFEAKRIEAEEALKAYEAKRDAAYGSGVRVFA
jgi:hypothetical protein